MTRYYAVYNGHTYDGPFEADSPEEAYEMWISNAQSVEMVEEDEL